MHALVWVVLVALLALVGRGPSLDQLATASPAQIQDRWVLTADEVAAFAVQGEEGTMPLPTGAVESASEQGRLVELYGERVRPVLVKAKCTLWDILEDEAVGEPEECWPMGTGFAYKAEGGYTYWATASHVIEGGLSFAFLWFGYQVEPQAIYIGSTEVPATLVVTDYKQVALVTEGELPIEPAPVFAEKVGVGDTVFSLGMTRDRYGDKTYYYHFVNRGAVVGATVGFPDADVHATLGAVSGESGSPSFVYQGGEFLWFATVETGWSNSNKTGLVLLRDGIINANFAGVPAPEAPGQAAPAQAKDVAVPAWKNWGALTSEQQALWQRCRSGDEKYNYKASFDVPGWVFETPSARIVISETVQFSRDFLSDKIPAFGHLSAWDDFIGGWELLSIEAK